MSFRDIALPLIQRGIPATPLKPRSKEAFLPGWQNSATTDPNQISAWDQQYGECNVGAVATGQPDGVWFLEIDSPEVLDRIKTDTGHDLISEVPTFLVRSRLGRGHIYFRNTDASMAMGNISQSYVKGGDFSVRQKNAYVVSAGSIHPHSNEPYTCLTPTAMVLPAPDWLIVWLLDQRTEKIPAKEGTDPRNERGLIPHGYIHGFLIQTAGKLRNLGLDGELLVQALTDLTYRNCEPPLDDAKIRQVARSVLKYEPGLPTGGDLSFTQATAVAAGIVPVPVPVEEVDLPVFDKDTYPTFPKYVWAGTSIYENFVKPVCEHNSRIDYFMWLPATILLLNYLGTKVKIRGRFDVRPFRGSIFSVFIGKRGETNKSSSVDDAMEYFRYMGCLAHAGRDTKTAEGRSLVWSAGSPEGFGIEMQKTNCKNGILLYDELSQLVKKAGIDGSTMCANLLTLYESKKFGNTVKTAKEAYSLEPDSYCASLIACCTTETFQDNWARMAGSDTGLNDRFTFILEPEELPGRKMKVDISTLAGSIKTKMLIDKAIQKGEYEIENVNNAKLQQLVALGNRYVDRAVKWALAIAIDLGLDIIDDECIDRGCDIVKYEIAVKQYLKSYDAETKEAALQLRMRSALEMAGGTMSMRDFTRKLHSERYGTTAWGQAYYGLLKAGILRQLGKGTKDDQAFVQVLIKRDIEEV